MCRDLYNKIDSAEVRTNILQAWREVFGIENNL